MQLLESIEPDVRAWDMALARLVRVAADAEARLARLIRVLAQLDGSATAVLMPSSVPAMAETADRLVTVVVRDPRLRDDLHGWVATVARLCLLRDTVVHTVWEPVEGEPEPVMRPVWHPDRVHAARTGAVDLSRTTSTLARRCTASSDELLLRLDKLQPELGAYSRV